MSRIWIDWRMKSARFPHRACIPAFSFVIDPVSAFHRLETNHESCRSLAKTWGSTANDRGNTTQQLGGVRAQRSQRFVAARNNSLDRDLMKTSGTNLAMALGLVVLGVAIGAAGIYIGDTDDAPGAALIGILLMVGMVALGVRTARRSA